MIGRQLTSPTTGTPAPTTPASTASPATLPAGSGSSCGAGLQCDGAGKCVGCLADSDCGTSSACVTYLCQSGTCVTEDTPSGLACPDDGNPCTNDLCDGIGTCKHPDRLPSAPGCGAGQVCDPGGACCGGLRDRRDVSTARGRGELRSTSVPGVHGLRHVDLCVVQSDQRHGLQRWQRVHEGRCVQRGQLHRYGLRVHRDGVPGQLDLRRQRRLQRRQQGRGGRRSCTPKGTDAALHRAALGRLHRITSDLQRRLAQQEHALTILPSFPGDTFRGLSTC